MDSWFQLHRQLFGDFQDKRDRRPRSRHKVNPVTTNIRIETLSDRPVTDCIRRKSCVIQTGKSEFKSLYRVGPMPISIKGSTIFNLPYIIRSSARQIFPSSRTDMPCNVTGLFRGGWNVKINEPFMEVGVGAARWWVSSALGASKQKQIYIRRLFLHSKTEITWRNEHENTARLRGLKLNEKTITDTWFTWAARVTPNLRSHGADYWRKMIARTKIWKALVVADRCESVRERTIETKTYNEDWGWTNANCYSFRTSGYWLYTRRTE